jgi:hypothetical protein
VDWYIVASCGWRDCAFLSTAYRCYPRLNRHIRNLFPRYSDSRIAGAVVLRSTEEKRRLRAETIQGIQSTDS